MDFRSIFGVLGNVTSFIMFLLPAQTIFKLAPLQPGNLDEQEASNNQLMLYIAGIVSHLMWVFYGDLKHDRYVIIINVIGATLELLFSILFALFTRPLTTLMKHIATILFMLFPLYALGIVTVELDDPHVFAGGVCAVTSFMLCLMKYGYEAEGVPFFDCVLSLASAFIWTVYGLTASDLVILVPSLLWTLRWLLQLAEHSIRNRALQQHQRDVEMGDVSRTEPTEPESEA